MNSVLKGKQQKACVWPSVCLSDCLCLVGLNDWQELIEEEAEKEEEEVKEEVLVVVIITATEPANQLMRGEGKRERERERERESEDWSLTVANVFA